MRSDRPVVGVRDGRDLPRLVSPPHHEMSGMTMPHAPVSRRSRNSHFPPRVSLTQIGTRVFEA